MEATAPGHKTLLLSQSYEPIKVISWQRAITLLFLGKVEVVEEYGDAVRSVTFIIKIPSVVRLLRAFRRHHRPVKFSRVNIYARDGYACQYCGDKLGVDELTYDHVVPRSQGGRTEWTNIVTACHDCNRRKGYGGPFVEVNSELPLMAQLAGQFAGILLVTVDPARSDELWSRTAPSTPSRSRWTLPM